MAAIFLLFSSVVIASDADEEAVRERYVQLLNDSADDGQVHDSAWYDRKRHEARGEPMPRKKIWPGVTGSYTEYKPDKEVKGNWQSPTTKMLIYFVVFTALAAIFIWRLQKSKEI